MASHRMLHSRALLAGCAISSLIVLSPAPPVQAQEGPFTNASMNGTYMAWQVASGPDEPAPNYVRNVVAYYDGQGGRRFVSFMRNRSGAPDADGKATRDHMQILDDPATWSYSSGTYEVLPFGAFLYQTPNSTLDGIITKTEMIDGVLTATEYSLYGRGTANLIGGGVTVFHARRITGADVLPPAPADK